EQHHERAGDREDLLRCAQARQPPRPAELLRVLEIAVVLVVGDAVPELRPVLREVGLVGIAGIDARLPEQAAVGLEADERVAAAGEGWSNLGADAAATAADPETGELGMPVGHAGGLRRRR